MRRRLLIPTLLLPLACLPACHGTGPSADMDGGAGGDGGPQGTDSLWSRGFGGPQDDSAHATVDTSGSSVVAGGFRIAASFGGSKLTSNGDLDVYVARYAPDGTHMWSKSYGGPGADQATAAAIDDSGNVIVAGSFSAVADLGGGKLASAGDTDVFLAKYDGGGQPIWARRYGGPMADTATAVAVDRSGNVIVAGSFQGAVDFGGGPLSTPASSGTFIAKYDPSGKYLWSRAAMGPGAATAYGVAADGNGDVLVAGTFQDLVSFGGTPLVGVGGKDIFLVKLSGKDGAHVWSSRYGGPGDDIGTAVVADTAGNVLLCGSFEIAVNFGGTPLASLGKSDAFVVKFDSGGKHVWSRRGGGPEVDAASGISVDKSGNAEVTGSFRSAADFGGGPLASLGEDDVFVARYGGGDGKLASARRYGGPGSDVATSIAAAADGSVTVAGVFHFTAMFGGPALISAGMADGFAMRLAP